MTWGAFGYKRGAFVIVKERMNSEMYMKMIKRIFCHLEITLLIITGFTNRIMTLYINPNKLCHFLLNTKWNFWNGLHYLWAAIPSKIFGDTWPDIFIQTDANMTQLRNLLMRSKTHGKIFNYTIKKNDRRNA
ncbi:hypothetical protein MHBO_001874 [Bonamia ostreae]|uniref:Uncharacterized protein n=1 Tax=Bonamia ostreae TaxID=126728 RepID=A0ABV2AKM1_9EUKA